MEISYGYCHCGCGQKTGIASRPCKKRNQKQGEPYRFIRGHHLKNLTREQTNNWRGGRSKTHGYYRVYMPEHPKRDSSGYVREHALIAEIAIGKLLPKKAIVHHIDGNRSNNVNSNLVVCEDNAYHRLIHQKTNALKACGHANWRRCQYCKKYDEPQKLYISPNRQLIGHYKCRSEHEKLRPKRSRKIYKEAKIKSRATGKF